MLNILRSSLTTNGSHLIRRNTRTISRQNFLILQRSFHSEKPQPQSKSKENPTASKYREAFEGLKQKINKQSNEDDRMSNADPLNQMKNNIYSDFKYGTDKIDPAKEAEVKTGESLKSEHYVHPPHNTQSAADATHQTHAKEAHTTTQQAKINATTSAKAESPVKTESSATTEASATDASTKEAEEKAQAAKIAQSLKEKISGKAPWIGKAVDFVADSWEQTFPSDRYQIKAEQARKIAKETAEKEKVKKEYTEEELAQIQEEIADWKRTAMTTHAGDEEADQPSMREKLAKTLKEKFNNTDVAKKLYQTQKYKDYEEFKTEMTQFREDLKDHLSQSENPAVIASMAIYSKATTESNTAAAIKEARKYIKDFDVFDLERDCRGIFCDIFNNYLEGNLTYLEKVCEDAGLAYFKSLIKRREAEGVYPKYTQLWDCQQADFVGGKISSERTLPCFTYTIQLQEIHCNISKKTGKVVDGADDRVLQNRYNFTLSLHDNPDLETVGHRWVLVEVLPIEAVHMLA